MIHGGRGGAPERAPIPGRRLSPSRDALWIAALAVILVATLTPMAPRPRTGVPPPPISSDLIRNVLLFVPLGVGLRIRGLAGASILCLAFALSAFVETVQLGLPGRAPSLRDVLANTAGGGLGAALSASYRTWRWPSTAGATRRCVAAGVLSVVVLTCRGFAAAPAVPTGNWFVHWTPTFARLEHYDGALIAARIGDQPLPHSRLGGDPEPLRSALAGDFELRLVAVAGRPPPALAPLFMIRVGRIGEVLLVGIDGADLVLRLYTRGQAFRFEPRSFRLPGALEDVRPGDRFELLVRRTGGCVRTQLDGRSLPDRGPTPGDGWTLFLWDWLVPSSWQPVANAAWLALLVLPMGYWARRNRACALALAAVAATLAGLPLATPVLGMPMGECLGAVTGLLAGRALRRVPPGDPLPERLGSREERGPDGRGSACP